MPNKHASFTSPPPDKFEITTEQQRIINIIHFPGASAKNIMQKLGLKNRENLTTNYSRPMMDSNLIKPQHPDKPHHPRQKYVSTDKGVPLLSVKKNN